MATLLAAPRPLLLILLLAGLHSASASLIRPLFQVSDEVTYLASIQRSALAEPHEAALAPCLSPPDGAEPPAMPAGGKWLFHAAGARLLRVACEAGAGAMAPIWLRLAFSLSLPVIAWAAWQGAALLTGGTWAPAVAALAIATQPVLAKYAGAVAPDSLANAAAAIAILMAARSLVLGPTALRLGALVAWTGVAAALKDSTLFLVPLHGLVIAVALLRPSVGQRRLWVNTVVALAGVLSMVGLGALTRTSYPVAPGLRAALDAPLAFATRVTLDLQTQLPSLAASAWTSLGGFGGTAAPLPTSVAAIVIIVSLVSLVGLTQAWIAPRSANLHGVTWYLLLAVLACLVQAPVRQVLLGSVDVHQGRWLFPVAMPIAFGLAVGLERALGQHAARAWPLVTLAGVLVMVLPWLSVVQWHVATSDWALDRSHLFLFSTGGLDIDARRVEATIMAAWPASPLVVVTLATLGCLCIALMLRLRPAGKPDPCPTR